MRQRGKGEMGKAWSGRHGLAASAACLFLTACGDSGLNPFGWFSRPAGPETLPEIELAQITDNRPMVVQVTSVAVEPLPGGIILRATGLPPTQGWWDADLVAEGEPEAGVATLSIRARPPATPQPVSTVQSRELVVGAYLSDRELAGVTTLRVRAGRNSLAVRR